MAKVKGPLFSIDASGAVAESMVHANWKGIHVVRGYVEPSNPSTENQKVIRQFLAAMGKNTVKILTPQIGLLLGSLMYQLLKAATPAGQIWNACFGKQTLDYVKTPANWTLIKASLAASAATPAVWESTAIGLGMIALDDPKYSEIVSPGLQLFMGGYAAFRLALTGGTSNYNTHPKLWTATILGNFATDYIT